MRFARQSLSSWLDQICIFTNVWADQSNLTPLSHRFWSFLAWRYPLGRNLEIQNFSALGPLGGVLWAFQNFAIFGYRQPLNGHNFWSTNDRKLVLVSRGLGVLEPKNLGFPSFSPGGTSMPKMIKMGEIRVLSYFHLSWNEDSALLSSLQSSLQRSWMKECQREEVSGPPFIGSRVGLAVTEGFDRCRVSSSSDCALSLSADM